MEGILRKGAEKQGSFPEELALELLEKRLNAEIDAEELAEALSEKYLEEAKAGDLVQASENLWEQHAVKAVAVRYEIERFSVAIHGQTCKEERRQRHFQILRLCGNLYENEIPRVAVETLADDVEGS